MGSGFFICPKYLGILIAFSVLKSYQNNPKWMDFKWWLIIGFALYTFGSIIYGRYQEGISIGILADIFWVILYLTILYIYMPKFEKKEEVDKRVKDIPLNFGKFIMGATGFILGLSVAIVILCICSFIPLLNFVTIPAMRIVGMVL
jgi:hypothetical protein